MKDIITLAKERADKFKVKNVVVSTNTGASAKLVFEVFGPGYKIFAVGNPAKAHERGLVSHAGVSEETQKILEQKGIKVILQDQSLIQALDFGGTDFKIGGKSFEIWGNNFDSAALTEVIENAGPKGKCNAVAIIYNTLQLFCDTTRVCIEVTLMAADSGLLLLNEDCIAIARPIERSNCPHAAVILRPTKTNDIFMGQFRVKDIILLPGPKDHWFNNERLWSG